MQAETVKAKPNNKGTGKAFDNPILERLSRTHILVPISILGSASIFVLVYGIYNQLVPAVIVPALFISGTLLFTLIEYLIHRYVFHIPATNEKRAKFQHLVHGIHHDYPKDKDRLAMPPILSAILSVAFFYLFYFMMGNIAYGFFPGFIFGYIGYLGVHYIVHAYQPPKNIFKWLWIYHGMHHYKYPNHYFGVSSPLWDYVFRTIPKEENS